MNTFDLRLDLDKSSAIQVVTLRQGDVDGTTVSATVYDHGALADLSVASAAYFVMRLPDNEHYYRKAATVDGSTLTVTVDETQAASVAGRSCNAYFTVSVGADTLSTASFVVAVLPDAVEGAELPEDYDNAVQEAINRCNAAAAVLETLQPLTTAEVDAITNS